MLKITYLDALTLGDTPLDAISALGELTTWPGSTPEEAVRRVSDCDVLIVNKVRVTRELLAAAPRLSLVCEAATGVDNIDLEACAERGIKVRNVAGYSTESVVQETWMHILSLAGNGPYYDGRVKDGAYSASGLFTDLSGNITELDGKVIGIIGMGKIGHRVAEIAVAFGMKAVYYSTSGTSHCEDYPSLPLEELLGISDIVSIHAPLNGRTRGLIGRRELEMMKPTAFLVNMGRGGIVDEAALAEAIDGETIAGAALDVFSEEPLPLSSPLLHVSRPERFRFTPHTAWASAAARARLVEAIASNIRSSF